MSKQTQTEQKLEKSISESMSAQEALECGILADIAKFGSARDLRGGMWVQSGDRYYRVFD